MKRKVLDSAAVALSAAALAFVGVLLFAPSALVLITPGIKTRSPFCSAWKATRDMRIKLHQQATAANLETAARLRKRESGLALWSTPAGEYWIPDGKEGQRILPILLAQEERNIYGVGEWGVHRGDVVLDVGAYIGTWTRQALARGARRVIAIEPSPASVECLKRNLAAEIAAGRVTVYPQGIWDSVGTLSFFVNTDSGVGNSFVEKNAAASAMDGIPVTTIDRLAADLQLPHVDFIKADVKGATERLLRGAANVIQRDRPRIALSTEEEADDAGSIARLALSLEPRYQVQCGPCLLDGKSIYTDVLFFRPF